MEKGQINNFIGQTSLSSILTKKKITIKGWVQVIISKVLFNVEKETKYITRKFIRTIPIYF